MIFYRKSKFVIAILIIVSGWGANLFGGELPWQFFVRTSGHPLSAQTIDSIIADAQNTHLFGIEVDNDITGRYDSFLNPQQKLDELRELVQMVHAINNHAFVYIAGLECITPNAEQRQHTFFKDHPDWLQRDLTGRLCLAARMPSGSTKAMKMCGSVPLHSPGVKCTWNVCARLQPPVLTAFTWTFLTG